MDRALKHTITSRYEWHTEASTLDLLETIPDMALPVFERTMTAPGLSLIVMDRDFVSVSRTVGGFLEFLEHEEQLELGDQY